jgi:glutamate 5-kinase
MSFLPTNARRLVVKVGTQTLTGKGRSVDPARVRNLCAQVAAVRASGIEVVVVSSGAVGLGMGRLDLTERPRDLATLQACAAIGQTLMIETWRTGLEQHGLLAAQILLTREDVRGRRRHLSARTTLERLLALGAVPIVNENDTVSADEIKFGDNDLLSALVASLLRADLLVILTTARGLLDLSADRLIPVVEAITPEIEALAGGTTSTTAVGGMTSKLTAAKVAVGSGCGVFIGDGQSCTLLPDLLQGTAEGTFFVPSELPLGARKRWLAFFSRPAGTLVLDAGATEAIRHKGGSLLAKGVTACEGDFQAGDTVALAAPDGTLVARGQVAYSQAELSGLLGLANDAIAPRFPARHRLEVVHRDQLVLL